LTGNFTTYNKTKPHKYLKEFETLHVRPMSESDQCLYDTALGRDFKILHRLKYAYSIGRIEGGWKNNPQGFVKYADMKRNASGYPLSMFLRSDCARVSQSIANLFAVFFQSVYIYVRDDWIPDSDQSNSWRRS
jgi:hypothetical protein